MREVPDQERLSTLKSRRFYYPCVQFEDDGVVEGLERVLDAMHVQAPWVRLQLFMDDDVLGALTDGRVDDAVRAAGSYLPREGSESRELESGG